MVYIYIFRCQHSPRQLPYRANQPKQSGHFSLEDFDTFRYMSVEASVR